jgi:hypothetical protein
MRRHLLFLACLAAILAAAPAAEARPERRIDLDAAALLASASASKPVVAVECVRARAALHRGSRTQAICLIWTVDGRGEPGNHCLHSRHVRFGRRHGSGLKAGRARLVMCGLAAPRA